MALPTRPAPRDPPASSTMHAEMNVTPMLDVLLVILIIFMTMIAVRSTIELQLPDPEAIAQDDPVPLVLEVGPNGYYALDQQVIPSADLASRLRAIYAERSDKRIILHGARTARYQEVIRAMDIARGAGVTVIGTEMRPRPTRSGSVER